MRHLLFGLAFIFTGCTAAVEAPGEPPEEPGYKADLTSQEKAACVAAGGIVERAGLAGIERCTRIYSDAGKPCKGSDECEGQCRAGPDTEAIGHKRLATGICQATDNPFGCFANVENGTLGPMLCVD